MRGFLLALPIGQLSNQVISDLITISELPGLINL